MMMNEKHEPQLSADREDNMSLAPPQERLQLPESLRDQLFDYRRRVWSIKMIEAVAAAIFGLLVAFLLMFLIDRLWDTPLSVRLLLFVSAWVGAAIVPLAFYRWIWRNRRLEQAGQAAGPQTPPGWRPVAGRHRAGPQ